MPLAGPDGVLETTIRAAKPGEREQPFFLAAQGEGSGHRVVGSYLTETDAARGAALAVLNATNRILGNRLFMR